MFWFYCLGLVEFEYFINCVMLKFEKRRGFSEFVRFFSFFVVGGK